MLLLLFRSEEIQKERVFQLLEQPFFFVVCQAWAITW